MRPKSITLLSFFAMALPACACEPVMPLAVLFAGELSLAVLAQSFPLLFAAVGLKCAVLAWLTRKLLPWYKAVILMLLGNVLSTLVGVAAAIPATTPIVLLIILPALFLVTLHPARRYAPWLSGQLHITVKPGAVAGMVTLLFVSSFALIAFASDLVAPATGFSPGAYWLTKISAIYMALLLSISLTIYIEEAAISSLAKPGAGGQLAYLPAVARANLAALLLITLVGAMKVLPTRFASPNFLIPW